MLPLIMVAIGAAGAVAGAVTTHAANEKDRQAAKRYEKVNAELINSRDKLQQRYYELSDRSKKQINDLNLKLAESEMEKDLVYLALSLYHELMALREDIDINPSFEVLVEFHKAIVLTNYVLQQLDKRLVPVSQDYFSRTLTCINKRDNLSKEQLFSFMAELMNPQQDTVTSFLGEVQNDMFSQQILESEEIVNDNSAELWSQQGEKFLDTKEYAQALICFEKAIAINPDNSEYWYWKGRVLFSLDRYKEFIYSLDKAIAIAPENDEYRDWRSRVYCVDAF
jgi:tetratricopeptide (TPR) repeat protein